MGSKSLGVLTLDVIAKIGGFVDGLSKAERETKRKMGGISKSITLAAGSLGALTVAAAASAAAIVTKTAASAKEIQNLSRAANTSAEKFQKIAYASKQFGVEQDKVADILKDTSDKIGDYLTTGAGPMADFFETVAPLVGVTAEQFRNLSGPDALQLYVKSLEKANLSQSQMTFFMEAIASDSTKLLPLLKDNGKELGRLAEQADTLGVVLSDLEIKQLDEVARSTKILGSAFDGAANQFTVGLLPAMNELSKILQEQETIEALGSLARGFGDIATFAVKAGTEVVNFTKYYSSLREFIQKGAPSGDIVLLEDQLKILQDMKNSGPLDRIRFFGKGGLVEYYNESELDAEIAEVTKKLQEAYDNIPAKAQAGGKAFDIFGANSAFSNVQSFLKSIQPTKDQLDAQKKLNEEFQKMLDNYHQQIALTGNVTELEKIRYEVTNGSLKGITTQQLKELEANAALVDGYNDLVKAAEEAAEAESKRAELKSQFQSLQDSILSESELEQKRHKDQLDLLEKAQAENIESIKPFHELREQLEQEHQDRLTEIIGGADAEQARFAMLSGKDKARAIASQFQMMSQATAAGNRKMFELNKVASIANATLNAYDAIASSYKYGSQIGGPILGATFAALASAAQFATIAQISGQSFGGGAVAPSVSATGATALVQTTQTAQQITPQSSGPSVVVNISGPVTGLDEDILADRINDLIERDYINVRAG